MTADPAEGGCFPWDSLFAALRRGGYRWHPAEASSPDEALLTDDQEHVTQGKGWLVSLLWREGSTPAEEQVCLERLRLWEAMENCGYRRGCLVLAGEGWDFCGPDPTGGLQRHASFPGLWILALPSFLAHDWTQEPR